MWQYKSSCMTCLSHTYKILSAFSSFLFIFVSVLIIYYSPPLTLNHFCAPTFILIKNNEVSFVIFLVIDCVIGVRMI